MILSLFSRYVRNGIIRFKNDDAIPSVYSIILFTDNSSGNFKRKEFRWSYDNDNWSSWEKLTQSNISSINIEGQPLYLEVRYEPLNDSTVSEFNIKYNNGNRLVEVKTSGTDSSDFVEREPTQSTSLFTDRNVRVYDSDLLNGKTGNYYLQRYNQIGKQPISSIDGLQELLYEYYNGLSGVEDLTSTHDISIGILRNDVDLNEASIYLLESRVDDIDASLSNLYLGTSVGQLIAWIEDVESSVNFLYNYKDIQDVSILELFSQSSTQSTQISNLQSKDDSHDSSLNYLYNYRNIQDTSITDLYSQNVSQDSSIDNLQIRNDSQDSSIDSLQNTQNDQTGYINELYSADNVINASINDLETKDSQIDASLEDLYTENDIQDSSIIGLRDSIESLDSSLELNYVKETSLGNTFSFENGIIDVSSDFIRSAENIGTGKEVFYEKDASSLRFKTIDGSNGLIIFDTSNGLIVDASVEVTDPLTIYGDTYSGNLKYHINNLYYVDKQVREIGDKNGAVVASTGVTQLASLDASLESQNQFQPWGEVIWDETGNDSYLRYKDWNIFFSNIQEVLSVDVSTDVSSYTDGVYGIYITHTNKVPSIQLVSNLDRISYADKSYMGLLRVNNGNITNIGTSPDIFGMPRFMRDRNSYSDFFENGMTMEADTSASIRRSSGSYMSEGVTYDKIDFYNQTFTGSQHIINFTAESPVTFYEGDPSLGINPSYSPYTDLRTYSNLYWDTSTYSLQTAPDGKYILASVYMTVDNLEVIQRGSKIYDTMDNAESDLSSFSLYSMPLPNVFTQNFPRISYFVLKTDVNDLTDETQFKTLTPTQDGRIISGGSGTTGIVGAENIGDEYELYAGETNNILQFKTIQTLTNQVLLNDTTDTLTIDTSIYDPDPSLQNLYSLHESQDNSINELYDENDIQDSSIIDLKNYNALQDSRLAVHPGKNIDIDASNVISVEDSINLTGDASIEGHLDVYDGYFGLARPLTFISTDTSTSRNSGTLLLANTITVTVPDSTDSGNILKILSIDSSTKTVRTQSGQEIGDYDIQRLTRDRDSLSIVEVSTGYKLLSDTRLEFDITAPMPAAAETAEEQLDGTVVSTNDLDFPEEVVPSGTQYTRSAIRFDNVTVPLEMTITDFIIEFVADDADDGPVPPLIIRGEKVGDSSAFSTSNPYDLTSRSVTDASVRWEIDASWNTGEKYYTPDLREVAQEIADLPDWKPGNAFTIFIDIAEDASHNGNARSAVSDQITGFGTGYVTDETIWINTGNYHDHPTQFGNFLDYPVTFIQADREIFTVRDRSFIGNANSDPSINFFWRDASEGYLFELDITNNVVRIGQDEVVFDTYNKITNYNTSLYINKDLSINELVHLQAYDDVTPEVGDLWFDGSILYFRDNSGSINLTDNVLKTTFDSSIAEIYNYFDPSIDELRSKDDQIDSSLNYLYNENDSQDASIDNLQTKDDNLDTSINDLYTYTNTTFLEEASIGNDFRFVDGSLASNIWNKDNSNNIYPIDSSDVVSSQYIEVPHLSNSTYTTQLDRNDVLLGAPGIIQGAEVTDNGDGTLTISASQVTIRDSSSNVGTLYFADVAATDITPYNYDENEIYVKWNNGNPIYDVSTGEITEILNNRDQYLHIAEAYREDTDIYFSNNKQLVGNFVGKYTERLKETNTASKINGIKLIEREDGGNPNYIQITKGSFWLGLSEIDFNGINTASQDFFTYWYRDGAGGWNKITSRTRIDKDHYDDGTGTLADVSIGNFNTHWAYIAGDKSVHIQYGTQNTDSENLDQSLPDDVPRFLKEDSLLVGRITTKQNKDNFIDITIFNGFNALSNVVSKSIWGQIDGDIRDQDDLDTELKAQLREASIGDSLYWNNNILEVSSGYVINAENYGDGYGVFYEEEPPGNLKFRTIDATNGNILINDSSTLLIDSSIYIDGTLTATGKAYSGNMKYHFENNYFMDKQIRGKSRNSASEIASSGITQIAPYDAPDSSQGEFYPWGEIVWDPSGNSSILELNNWNVFFTKFQEVIRDSGTLDVSSHSDGIYSVSLEANTNTFSINTQKVFDRVSYSDKAYFALLRVYNGNITNLCVSPDIYGTPKIVRDKNLFGFFDTKDLNVTFDTSSNFVRGSGSYTTEGVTYDDDDFYNNTFTGPQNIKDFSIQNPMVFYEGDPSVAYDTSIGSYTDFRLYSDRYWDTSLGDFNTAPSGKYLISGIVLSTDDIHLVRKGSILYDSLTEAEDGIADFDVNSMPLPYACNIVFPLISYIICRTDASDLSDPEQVSIVSNTRNISGGATGGGGATEGILGADNVGTGAEVYQSETNNELFFRTLISNDTDVLNITQQSDTIEFSPKDFDPSISDLYNTKADQSYVDASLNLKADQTYVDSSLDLKVDKSGDTMSGTLNVPDISVNDVSIDGSLFLTSLDSSINETYILSFDPSSGKVYSSSFETTSLSNKVFDVSTNTTIEDIYGIYHIDTTYSDVTITLPDITSETANKQIRVLKNGGNNIVYITTVSGAQLIGDETTQSITQQEKGFALVSDPIDNKWLIIQDSRFLEGTADGELQYWDETLETWAVTPDLIWEASTNTLYIGDSPNTFYVDTNNNLVGVDSSLYIGNPSTGLNYLVDVGGDVNVTDGYTYRLDGSSLYDIFSTIEYVDASLDLKADITYVDASLDLKADITYVDASLDLKADITYVDASLDLKVDKAGDTMSGDLITTGLQVNNDISVGGYIDASEYIHLSNFDNITPNIGDIWFDPSARINAYAQVLDSTRDASTTNLNDRLTRSNNDYQSFPEIDYAKEQDKFLVEDVSDNHEKKYINGYNMRYSMTGGFGQYPAFLEDRVIFETTSQTYVQANRLTTDPSADAGTYRIAWTFYGTHTGNNDQYQYRIQVDDTTTIDERTRTVNPASTYSNHSGFTQITLTAGPHNIDLDVRSVDTGTTSIDDVRIEFWRVN